MKLSLLIILVFCIWSMAIGEEVGVDDISCDKIDKGLIVAQENVECTNEGKVGIIGSCTKMRSCYYPPSTNKLLLSSIGLCPAENTYNVIKRTCEPVQDSEKCPQKRCFPKETHEKPAIYPMGRVVTVAPRVVNQQAPGSNSQPANNEAISIDATLKLFSLILTAGTVIMTQLM